MTRDEIKQSYGICGLVCALCSYNSNCSGCQCKTDNCEIKTCCLEKGLDYCFECSAYPCDKDMHKGIRSRAFNIVAKNEGLHKLAEYLYNNLGRGITYHRAGGLTGDYDRCRTVEEVIDLLKKGKPDPYVECPEFETKRLKLRQVREDDAAELLLSFYGDLSGWMFYGNDMCKRIFASRYATLEEMKNCIRSWLEEYKNKYYIRLSVIEKESGKAIGTIEIFDKINRDKNQKLDAIKHGAVLHIDLAVPYETKEYISELLNLADKEFYTLFSISYLLIRAIPDAKERITALLSAGYEPFEWEPGREYYYMKRNPQNEA